MPLTNASALAILHEEAANAFAGNTNPSWDTAIDELSALSNRVGVYTHIAFLGTAILAKATDSNVDVYSVKQTGKSGSYSARNLAHGVLVKSAPGLEIHLGVTGREPLNNMPYFRMERFDDGTRIAARAKPIVDQLKTLLARLAPLSQLEAKAALRSFIFVRRRYAPKYAPIVGSYLVSVEDLTPVIEDFVAQRSDGGRRAQAVTAGLLDVFAGEERVYAGRINDPSRHNPGDVGVRDADDLEWERVFEVRDKPVEKSDVEIFAAKCAAAGVIQIAVVAIAQANAFLDGEAMSQWALGKGLSLRIFQKWKPLVEEIAFWSAQSSKEALSIAIERIYARLVDIEAPPETVSTWLSLVAQFQVSTNEA